MVSTTDYCEALVGVVLNLLGSNVMYVRQAVTVKSDNGSLGALSRQRLIVTWPFSRPAFKLLLMFAHVANTCMSSPV